MRVEKKGVIEDCTYPSKKYFFSSLEISKNIFLQRSLIFISKPLFEQYKPPEFPSRFVSIVGKKGVEKTTFARRVYFVERTLLKTAKEATG